jgi:hypothetical protein
MGCGLARVIVLLHGTVTTVVPLERFDPSLPHPALIKKVKFSSYTCIRIFRWEWLRKGFLIYEEMLKYLVIYEETVSHK